MAAIESLGCEEAARNDGDAAIAKGRREVTFRIEFLLLLEVSRGGFLRGLERGDSGLKCCDLRGRGVAVLVDLLLGLRQLIFSGAELADEFLILLLDLVEALLCETVLLVHRLAELLEVLGSGGRRFARGSDPGWRLRGLGHGGQAEGADGRGNQRQRPENAMLHHEQLPTMRRRAFPGCGNGSDPGGSSDSFRRRLRRAAWISGSVNRSDLVSHNYVGPSHILGYLWYRRRNLDN